ncbi:hypothetical protein DFH07DRAFT_819757 [Mycena maculata]|uniref:Uncharacterized protein n=1 Tax=Mycena maculata TaxID=230809 RepID=A0AAD7J6E1_9AGAR|nr:hypothetical protein DFH07DRAFT_819757 [Mycena maculata]
MALERYKRCVNLCLRPTQLPTGLCLLIHLSALVFLPSIMRTTTAVPIVQRRSETTPTINTCEGTEANPVNHNGPQCAHCGWRGGEHAKNCPFNAASCRRS